MTDEARIRLLSGVRVSLLVLSEIRLAMREGRDTDPVAMRATIAQVRYMLLDLWWAREEARRYRLRRARLR